jgi:hypothetical protein
MTALGFLPAWRSPGNEASCIASGFRHSEHSRTQGEVKPSDNLTSEVLEPSFHLILLPAGHLRPVQALSSENHEVRHFSSPTVLSQGGTRAGRGTLGFAMSQTI